MSKRIISIFIACLILLSAFAFTVAAADDVTTTKAAEKVRCVLIGDSVAAGKEEKLFGLIKGTTPYGSILGDKKNYAMNTYVNNEYKSADVLNIVKSNEGARDNIAKADLVIISMGMCDFIDCQSLSNAIKNFNKDSAVKELRTNLRIILLKIRELNADAPIIITSLYKPSSSAGDAVDALNSVYADYLLNEKPGAFFLVDLDAAFAGNGDYVDDIIPSKKGNEKIVEVLIKQIDVLEKAKLVKYSATKVDETTTESTTLTTTTTNPSASSTTVPTTSDKIPKTGDSGIDLFYIFLALSFLSALSYVLISTKKKTAEI